MDFGIDGGTGEGGFNKGLRGVDDFGSFVIGEMGLIFVLLIEGVNEEKRRGGRISLDVSRLGDGSIMLGSRVPGSFRVGGASVVVAPNLALLNKSSACL